MDRLSSVMNSVPLMAGENVMEPLMVQSPSSAVDCMAHGGFELIHNIPMEMSTGQSGAKQQTTVLPAGMTLRATNPQLQQQKLLWQQQQQLLRQQQLLQQQYVQQQMLQNALLQAMQQVQNQSTANRSFSSSPVIVSPPGVPASSSPFVAIQLSANDQAIQSRPVSMATAAATTLPITTSPTVQPSMVHLGGVRMVPEPSMVQLGGVRMVPVAPFVTNQLRSPQPSSAMLISRPQQQPLMQRPFIIGQPGLVSSGVQSQSASMMNTYSTQRPQPVLVSASSQTPLNVTAAPPVMSGMQNYPLSQLAQVQQLSTRFVGTHNATPSANQMAYVSPVLPSIAAFGDNSTISPGAFQVPSDMSSVLTDTLKLSPSLVGAQFLTHQTSFETAAGPMQELSLTTDGRIVNTLGRPVQPEAFMQPVSSSVTANADAVVLVQPSTISSVSSSVNAASTPSQLPLAAATSMTSVSTSPAVKPNVTALADENLHRNPSDKPITVISSEPDKPDSCILTHIIEGFVIREGPVPFPVHKSFLNELPVSDEDDDMANEAQTSDFDSSDQDDSNVLSKVPTPKSDKVTISETPCEYCGKTGFEVRFGRPHRFCSLACSSKQHVALTKPGIRQMSSDLRDNSSIRRKSTEEFFSPSEVVLSQDVDHVPLAGRELHTGPCHPLDTSAGPANQPTLVQRSPVYHRHESPIKSSSSNSSYRYQPVQPSPLSSGDTHLSEWGVQEVCEFVRSLPDCSMYADDFRRQEIDGQALMLLTEEHMMTSLNMKLGPALKICQRIRALKDL